MNILVTGGAGFIGSHVTLCLLNAGHNVFIIDSLINSCEKVVYRINNLTKKKNKTIAFFQKGDLKKIEDIEYIFNLAKKQNAPIEAVIHLAGLKSVNESTLEPIKYWDNNVIASHNLLKIMNKYNCKKIVFSSSATIYGDKYSSPIREDHDPFPINPYGFTKLAIENLLFNIYSNPKDKWQIGVLRYFNPVGNHFSGEIGEDPKSTPTNLFPILCQAASKRVRKLIVHGDNWNTIDGTGVRDYIHVMDLAEGHLKTLEYIIQKDKTYITLNFGTGKGTSVLEFIKVFERVNNIKVEYEIGEKRNCDSAEVFADCSKVKTILGWKAKRSLEDICKDGWLWCTKNPLGYQK